MGVLAMLLLVTSVAAGLHYSGNKGTLGRQQAGAYQTNPVKQAIRTFVARNFRLPCPADGTAAQGSATDGVEAVAGSICTISGSKGVVPWKTLGISYRDALDRFGSRLGYAVSPHLSDPLYIPTSQVSFLTTPKAQLDSYNTVGLQYCTSACTTTTLYAYVVISYGADQSGGYLLSGNRKAQPAATLREYTNTLDASFSGGGAFQVWPYNTTASAGTSYFDDVLIYQKASELVDDLNFQDNNDNNQSVNNNPTYGNPNSSTTTPSVSNQNTDASALTGSTGTVGNTYSCTSGSNYCPGSSNAGSLANTYSYASCSGNFCTAANNGECLNLNGNLGIVCVHDATGNNSGIYIGNGAVNGDWIGPNYANDCPECFVPGTPNYTIPNQTITYNWINTYKSWAFVDYLVDGGQQVVADAYQSAVYSITGDVVSGQPTITNVSDTTGLQVGQAVLNTTYFSDFTYITAISGTTVTVSNNAAATLTGVSFSVVQNGFYVSGTVTPGSNDIENISVTLNKTTFSSGSGMFVLAVNDAVTGPNIPAGATITAMNSAALSMTISAAAIGTGSAASENLFVTPWVKVGTRVASNGYYSNIANAVTISGITTASSTSMTNVSPTGSLAVGQLIAGPNLLPGTIISAVSGSTVTLSQAAISGSSPNSTYFYVDTTDLLTSSVTGDLDTSSTTVSNVTSTVGLTAGQVIQGYGVQPGTTITTVGASSLTMSLPPKTGGTGVPLFFTARLPITGITGDITSGSTLIQNVSPNTNGFVGNEHIDSPALPSGTYISGIPSSASLSISSSATSTQTGALLNVIPLSPSVAISGTTAAASTSITNVTTGAGLLAGEGITSYTSGLLSPGTYITSVGSGSPLTITVSQAASASSVGASFVVTKGTPIVATTGNVTKSSKAIISVSSTSGLATGDFVANTNLQDATTITAVASGGLSISKSAVGTQQAAALTAGYYPPSTTVVMDGTLSPALVQINNLPITALPGVGAAINGDQIQGGTISSRMSGNIIIPSSTPALAQTSAIHATYPACPGPSTSLGGLYTTPNDERGAAAGFQLSPIVQHLPSAQALLLPSQIWPQPGTAGSGVTSAGSNRSLLTGNYVDQRDNQIYNQQLPDSSGNAIRFNILVFQVLPYVYNDTSAVHSYGMLFEGAKGCYTDANAARCTMAGSDEWWNPPVVVTMDCGQYPQ